MHIKRIIKFIFCKLPFLSVMYKHWAFILALRKITVTPQGFKFFGNSQMMDGSFEPIETEIIKKLLQQSSIVINVGANIGYYCCMALSLGKHVIAFEPMQDNLKYLYKNVHLNNWGNRIECFPLALSFYSGLIEIFGSGTGASLVKGWAGQNYSTIVPVSSLDVVLGNRFGNEDILIIVDIEGAEYEMLKGARRFLSLEKKPIWLVEVTISEHQPDGVKVNPNLLATFSLFDQCGYISFTADDGPRMVSIDEISKIVKSGEDTLKTHNFIFVDKNRAVFFEEILNNSSRM